MIAQVNDCRDFDNQTMPLVEYSSDSESEDNLSGSNPDEKENLPPAVTKTPTPQSTPINNSEQLASFPSANEPLVGPSRPPITSASPELDEQDDGEGTPVSPYTHTRNLVHTLTLPTSIPSIPPSPPGSPPPSLAGRFSHFRELKTRGVHFNEKLLRSSSLRNPNLLQKLTAFVGLDSSAQYTSNLPSDLWNPTSFPKEAYFEDLAMSQTKIAEARERTKLEHSRESIDFVGSVQTQTQPLHERRLESAVERVMKGLDRESKKALSPPMREGKREKEEGRGGRRDGRERDWDWGRDRRRDDEARDRKRDDDHDRRRQRSHSRSKGDRDRDRGDRRYRDYEYRDRR